MLHWVCPPLLLCLHWTGLNFIETLRENISLWQNEVKGPENVSQSSCLFCQSIIMCNVRFWSISLILNSQPVERKTREKPRKEKLKCQCGTTAIEWGMMALDCWGTMECPLQCPPPARIIPCPPPPQETLTPDLASYSCPHQVEVSSLTLSHRRCNKTRDQDLK